MRWLQRTGGGRSGTSGRLRFLLSWGLAIALVTFALPRVLDVSWHGVIPVLGGVRWVGLLELTALWILGLVVQSVVLIAGAPSLTHRRALTLNLTGSAISNVVPLGGAAGMELNRRMMKVWGIDTRSFTGFTFVTNLWDIGSKLLLPVVGVVVLAGAGRSVTPGLNALFIAAGIGFVALIAFAAVLLLSPRGTTLLGNSTEAGLRFVLRLAGRDRPLGVAHWLNDTRDHCVGLVASGWVQLSLGVTGYVALQGALLWLCLELTGAGVTWEAVLVAFAAERLLTVVPITPGGVGPADLALVGALITLGGDPTGVAAAAVLYRIFTFAIEIPVGGGVLGLWLLTQWLARTPQDAVERAVDITRVAHVTDVFLPRLGGIETHVDDLVRHQRARGLDAEVLTSTSGVGPEPTWIRRTTIAEAARVLTTYDVVHVHLSVWSPFGISVARTAASRGIPTLVTVHSMWPSAGGLIRLIALAAPRRWPVVWSAVSSPAAAAFRRSLGRIDVAVLPNAIDVETFRPAASDRQRSPMRTHEEAPLTLVSVMRLAARKRPLALLRVFAELRRLLPDQDLRLVIVGDGAARTRAERYVRRHGLTQAVRITGRVPRQQVLHELRNADIYVAPAPKESFGIAALEARCAGLPVVAYRRSGVSEFVRDRLDGMLVTDDAEMVVALAQLVGDSELRLRITRHNTRIAPAHDWQDILERTEELYAQAAEQMTPATPSTADVSAPLAVQA